jgi:RNA polymerase sigma factor (sigma-70 family)
MRQIKNHNLAQLLMQLHFAPQKQRRRQLDSAEKLFSIISKDKEYPFEFICFRITGYHPKNLPEQQLIKGDELAEDLRIFISKLSGQIAPPAAEQTEKVYTIEELAVAFEVSTKTISRWRKRGLIARKFIFDDGVKRLGFLQSAVDRFAEKNPDLISKAKIFKRLTDKQKQQIIKQASALAAKTTLSPYQIIERVATQTGRVHETVRYILLNHEKANPDRHIFRKPPGVISPAQAGEIYKLFKQQGCDIKELTERFNRSKSSIYRIINRRRARAILSGKIEYVASDEFLRKDAEEKILSAPVGIRKPPTFKNAERLKLADGSLSEYLQRLKAITVLNREQEVEFFRRYNYLKYLAATARQDVKPSRVLSAQLEKIENCLAEAEAIKKIIAEANLRLVISIANKHTGGGANLSDLVSVGNFSLVRAVEKFDYTRGFRFATYASWIIAKDYARKIPAETARLGKVTTASLADVQHDLRITKAADFAAVERARKSLIGVIEDNLDRRERHIILNHFGLLGSSIKKKTKTLKQIGEELDLSKERVRQIELVALQKLRQSLSSEEFELLTG